MASKDAGDDGEREDEAFEDASETVHIPSEMDLHTSIEETSIALNLFLNNKFSEAKARMQPWADRSMYHALGYGTIMYLQAAMTFEMTDIENAISTVKKSVMLCNRFRKKSSVMSSFSRATHKTNYNEYTEEAVHAELCYAECLIQRALLTFVQDENLISFVKGSLKIRACYQSYKECFKMLQNKKWENEQQQQHFDSGVRMGIGTFNLMISLLPTKILKLLEFVGFSGNKQRGLSELREGSLLIQSLRGPLCSMILLAYHTVITYVLGTADGDIDLAETVLQPCMQNYPNGALFLFFAGRIHEIRGNLDKAVVKFEDSIESQTEWRQFHHLCFWELMWCHSFKGDWLLAMKYAEKLCRESRWSRATYTYQKAAFLMMVSEDVTEDTKAHIAYLMGEVPRLKQRIAGKSIPIEKFAVKKAKRYQTQNNRLTLPAYELIYVWNGFTIIGKKPELLDPILSTVEETINTIVQNKEKYELFHDDYCLALLLKGTCLRYQKRYFQAEQCFLEITKVEKQIKQDTYLVPFALVEQALMCLDNDHIDEAKKMLEKTKSYKGYSLESRLHFRIHAANLRIKQMTSPENVQAGSSSPASSPVQNDDLPDLPPFPVRNNVDEVPESNLSSLTNVDIPDTETPPGSPVANERKVTSL